MTTPINPDHSTASPVTTLDEAEEVIHLAALYFSNTLVGVSYPRARDLILQAAEFLRREGTPEDNDGGMDGPDGF